MIPEEIVIGPNRYAVEFVERLESDDHRRLTGQIDYSALKIRIDPAPELNRQVITLFHEIVHGIDEVYGLDLAEEDVDRMANGIVDVLQRNPGLLELVGGVMG